MFEKGNRANTLHGILLIALFSFAAFYIAEMLPAYISHPLRVRQFNRFLEQKVYK